MHAEFYPRFSVALVMKTDLWHLFRNANQLRLLTLTPYIAFCSHIIAFFKPIELCQTLYFGRYRLLPSSSGRHIQTTVCDSSLYDAMLCSPA